MKWYITDNIQQDYNAGSKAVIDVDFILKKNGYVPICLGYSQYKSLIVVKIILVLYRLILISLKVHKGDSIFIQYPIPINKFFRNILYKIIKYKKLHTTILVHDLNTLRFNLNQEEDSILYFSNLVICHTPNMKKYLYEIGVDCDIRILNLFDYLTDSICEYQSSFDTNVVFAGNLIKSGFIQNLSKIKNLSFLLYGLPELTLDCQQNVSYEGKFQPNDISKLKGDWGLVWDGDSINTCDGPLGEYLKYNSSHKASLYIAAGKPIIVWEHSALKQFVLDNNLGISVNSLEEINMKIKALNDWKKREIQDAIKEYSYKIKRGKMLEDILFNS